MALTNEERQRLKELINRLYSTGRLFLNGDVSEGREAVGVATIGTLAGEIAKMSKK